MTASTPLGPSESLILQNAALAAGNLTQPGTLSGMPMYVAPELSTGPKHAEPSLILFSFGVVTYELLIGRVPFDGPAVRKAMSGVRKVVPALRTPPPSLDASLPGVPTRCLSITPSDRPRAAEGEAALEKAAHWPPWALASGALTSGPA